MSGDKVFMTKPQGSAGFAITDTVIKPDGAGYTDTIHLSKCAGFRIDGCEIHGGSEDCIDLNDNCALATISHCNLSSGGRYCMTIKGGSHGIMLSSITIAKHGTEADIDLGNWSDQDGVRCGLIFLENVTSTDGRPVTVRVLWSDKPMVTNSNVKLVGILPWSGTGTFNYVLVYLWRFGRKRSWWGK